MGRTRPRAVGPGRPGRDVPRPTAIRLKRISPHRPGKVFGTGRPSAPATPRLHDGYRNAGAPRLSRTGTEETAARIGPGQHAARAAAALRRGPRSRDRTGLSIGVTVGHFGTYRF